MSRVCSELKFTKDCGHLWLLTLNPSIWFHPLRSRSFTSWILLLFASSQGNSRWCNRYLELPTHFTVVFVTYFILNLYKKYFYAVFCKFCATLYWCIFLFFKRFELRQNLRNSFQICPFFKHDPYYKETEIFSEP